MIQKISVTSGTLLRSMFWIHAASLFRVPPERFRKPGLRLGRAPKPIEMVERGERRIRLCGGKREHEGFETDKGHAMQRDLARTAARNGHTDIGQLRQRRIVGFGDQHGRQAQRPRLGEHRLDLAVEPAIGEDQQRIARRRSSS